MYRDMEHWPEILGSERLTSALLDRLTHRVQILEANGDSYRFREAKNRLKRHSPRNPKTLNQGGVDSCDRMDYF